MAGPGDEIAAGAGGRGHLRASHADREQVIGTLKAAFVQGMLAKDEFDLRVGQTFASRTCAELAAVTADLRAGLAAAQRPEPAREWANKKKKAVAALACAASGWVGILFALPPIPDGPFPVSVELLMFVLIGAVSTGWLLLFHAWLDQRAGRQAGAAAATGRRRRGIPEPGTGRPGRAAPARGIPVTSKPPKRRSVAAAAPCCPAGGHRPPRDTSRIRHSAALHQPSPAANPSR